MQFLPLQSSKPTGKQENMAISSNYIFTKPKHTQYKISMTLKRSGCLQEFPEEDSLEIMTFSRGRGHICTALDWHVLGMKTVGEE